MNKKIKLFSLLFVTFICMFFAGDVKACECYYFGEYKDKNLGSTTYYNVVMSYTASTADVVSFCQNSNNDNSNANEVRNCVADGAKAVRGNPFDVDSGNIERQNCSVDACNSAGIYYWSYGFGWEADYHQIVTRGYAKPAGAAIAELKAISKDQSDQVVNSNNMGQTVKDLGLNKSNIQAIIDYGNSEDEKVGEDTTTCEQMISKEMRDFLVNLFWVISIIGILLLLVMTAIEFIKVVTGQDDEGIKKAFKHTIIRIVCVVILFSLPWIISAIIAVINNPATGSDVKIGEDGEVICGQK